jgi:hypothetical protein
MYKGNLMFKKYNVQILDNFVELKFHRIR